MRSGRRIAAVAAIAWLASAAALGPRAAAAADPDPEAVLAELPFLDHPEPNRIFVDLAPEGHSRRLKVILDTGASHTVATPRAARELGLRVRRVKRDPYRRSTRAGRDLLIVVDVRSSDTASRTGWEYALLGGNFLSHFVVELDVPGRRVRLLDPDRYAVPEAVAPGGGEAVLPLVIAGNRPAVEVQLDGRRELLLLDTGMPLPLVLSGAVGEAARPDPSEAVQIGLGSVLGPVQTRLGWIDRLELGPFVHEGVLAAVAPRGFYNLGMSNDSVIGYDVLAAYVVRIDYPRRRLWLRRHPGAPRTFLGVPYEGLDDLAAGLRARDAADEAP